MKLATMRPCFFPYVGCWQLLNTVDRFVIYDDVNHIKGGWTNRNNILISSKLSYITAPRGRVLLFNRFCDLFLPPYLFGSINKITWVCTWLQL